MAKVTKLTEAQDREALELSKQGWSFRAIARHLGCTDKTAAVAVARAEAAAKQSAAEMTAEQKLRLKEETEFLGWIDHGHKSGYFTRCVLHGVPKVKRK